MARASQRVGLLLTVAWSTRHSPLSPSADPSLSPYLCGRRRPGSATPVPRSHFPSRRAPRPVPAPSSPNLSQQVRPALCQSQGPRTRSRHPHSGGGGTLVWVNREGVCGSSKVHLGRWGPRGSLCTRSNALASALLVLTGQYQSQSAHGALVSRARTQPSWLGPRALSVLICQMGSQPWRGGGWAMRVQALSMREPYGPENGAEPAYRRGSLLHWGLTGLAQGSQDSGAGGTGGALPTCQWSQRPSLCAVDGSQGGRESIPGNVRNPSPELLVCNMLRALCGLGGYQLCAQPSIWVDGELPAPTLQAPHPRPPRGWVPPRWAAPGPTGHSAGKHTGKS